ncbi:MAG: methyltransferase domain-containing protein [Anaerolineales bacterium]|nr:methyltransferase domain-containing protein [Anaerolineales bacterium]
MVDRQANERIVIVDHCPLCGSGTENHRGFEDNRWEGGVDRYVLCDRCGMVFQSPRMSDDALEDFYDEGYRQLVQGSEEPTEKDLRVQYGRARHLVTYTQKWITELADCLDIGSSTGTLLNVFQGAYGCEGLGVEPGKAYREFSRKRDIPAVADLDNLGSAHHHRFDLVVISHVLEHLPDPVTYLRELRRLWITSDGHLLIEVPNLYGHQALEHSHLTAFSADTLKEMLMQAGYLVVDIYVHGQPRSRIIPLYITALARPLEDGSEPGPVRSDGRGVSFRRKWGNGWRNFASRYLTRWAWLPWPDLDDESAV